MYDPALVNSTLLFNFLHLKSTVHGNLLRFAECPAKVRPFRTKTYTPPKSASLGRRYSGRGRRRNPCRETPPERKREGRKESPHCFSSSFLFPLCAQRGGERGRERGLNRKGEKRVLPVPLFLSSLFGGISCFLGPHDTTEEPRHFFPF